MSDATNCCGVSPTTPEVDQPTVDCTHCECWHEGHECCECDAEPMSKCSFCSGVGCKACGESGFGP